MRPDDRRRTVVMKMLPVLQRIWLQMPEPKWCISMGACASTGGIFDTYSVRAGNDRFMPVDMYVPGCPPRPEQLIQSIIDLQDKIQSEVNADGEGISDSGATIRKRASSKSCREVVPREFDAVSSRHTPCAVVFRGRK